MEYYSKAFFKENLFEYLLGLHLDPVANIRYRLCSVLPDLKRLIKLPSDKTLMQQLDTCVRRLLIGERDRDVAYAIKVAVEEMDKIPIQMESVSVTGANFFNPLCLGLFVGLVHRWFEQVYYFLKG